MPMNPRLLRPLARFQAPPPEPPGTPSSLLLRFDGDFADSSANALTVTVSGDTAISTATKKYGSGSGYFDGVAETRVEYADGDANFDFDADFTIEAWVYPTDPADYRTIITRYNGINDSWVFRFDGNGSSLNYLSWYAGAATGAYYQSPVTVALNTWHHVAIARSGSDVRMFFNGAEVGSYTNGGVQSGGVRGCMVGASDQPSFEFPFSGYIDDLRIVEGLAVYQSDFIPPAAQLSVNASVASPAPYGTFLFSGCVDGDLVGTYADGLGGRYTEIISAGSCS